MTRFYICRVAVNSAVICQSLDVQIRISTRIKTHPGVRFCSQFEPAAHNFVKPSKCARRLTSEVLYRFRVFSFWAVRRKSSANTSNLGVIEWGRLNRPSTMSARLWVRILVANRALLFQAGGVIPVTTVTISRYAAKREATRRNVAEE